MLVKVVTFVCFVSVSVLIVCSGFVTAIVPPSPVVSVGIRSSLQSASESVMMSPLGNKDPLVSVAKATTTHGYSCVPQLCTVLLVVIPQPK